MQQFDALVTGGSGFIGLAAVEQFLLGGKSVAVLDRLTPPREFLDYAQTLPGSVEVLQADIADKDAILHCLSRFQPDVVVHAAVATPDMHRERRTPELAVQTNIVGTQNLLEALRVSPVRRLVHLSTSGVYGDIANRPGFGAASETVLPDSVTTYALTKASAEKLVLVTDLGMDAVGARRLSRPWNTIPASAILQHSPQLLRVASAGSAAHLPAIRSRTGPIAAISGAPSLSCPACSLFHLQSIISDATMYGRSRVGGAPAKPFPASPAASPRQPQRGTQNIEAHG